MKMVVLFFAIIAVMRVVQQVCNKKVSVEVNDSKTFFRYGGYYQLCSAIFSLIYLCFVGFYGFDGATLLCAFLTALLFALDLFSNLQAIKGAPLVVCNMFSISGLFVPCVLGIFLFDEPMGFLQWIGLGLFVFSIYFLTASNDQEKKSFSVKTVCMLLLNFFANGLVMVVQKYFALKVPDGNVALYSALTFALNAFILYACMGVVLIKNCRNEKKKEGKDEKRIKPLPKSLLLYGGLLAIAIFSINLIVTTLAKSVPSVILFTVSSALSVGISCLVGTVAFKEKLKVKNIVGLLLGILAIVSVNVF